MRIIRELWRRVTLLLHRDRFTRELEEELRTHIAMRSEANSASGMSETDARHAARRQFGNATILAEASRDAWGGVWVEQRLRDLTVAVRGFCRAPSLAISAIVILGVGIGMSVAMFTVFRIVLVDRLPVIDQERLITLSLVSKNGVELPTADGQIEQLQRASTTMRAVAGVFHGGAFTFPLLDGDRPVIPNRAIVTGNFFDVLGARAVVGRLLRKEDDAQGDHGRSLQSFMVEPLVISHRAWMAWFGGDTSVVGHRLNDPYASRQFIVVGVAPAGLDYPIGTDYWIPIGPTGGTDVIARLSSNGTPSAARSEFLAMVVRSDPQASVLVARADVRSFPDEILGDVRPAFIVLGAAVVLLLLIACVNVGSLLLLRASTRSQEMAVRRAIGAGYGDILGQLVVESLVLAVVGGVLGLACAYSFLRLLLAFAPAQIPRMDLVSLAGAPVGVAILVTGVAVLLFGVIPALMIARGDLASPLRFDTRSGGQTTSRRRIRKSLVASQVALALVMVAGAGLLTRSLARLEGVRLGYQADHLSFLAVSFPVKRYTDTLAHIFPLGDQVFSRLRAVVGVTAVSPVLIPPFVGANVWQWPFDAEGQSASDAATNPPVPIDVGNADLLRTLSVPLLRGRGFTEADRDGAGLVVMVSESVARRFWPAQDPIGKRLRIPNFKWLPSGDGWRTVVGVVGDLHYRAFREPSPTVFMPWRQGWWQGWIAVRTTGELATLLPVMRRTVHEIDPLVTVSQAQPMDDLLAAPLAEPRLSAFLLSAFGLVALLLAAIGLYGVMAAAVRQQTREMGIRLVLGATPGRLRDEVLREALVVTTIGAIVGLAGALVSSRLLGALLFQISPTDPLALAGACALLLVVATAAAYLPARRATRIDPASVLRME